MKIRPRKIIQILGVTLGLSLFASVGLAKEAVVVRDINMRSKPTSASSIVGVL